MRIWRDQRGQSMVLFAVALPVLIAVAALALDVGRAQLVQAQQAAALDAASSAGAEAVQPGTDGSGTPYLTLDAAQAQQLAQELYDANVQAADHGGQAWTPGTLSTQVTQGPQGCTVQTSATAMVPTYLAPAVGLAGSIGVPGTSTAHPHSLGVPCQ